MFGWVKKGSVPEVKSEPDSANVSDEPAEVVYYRPHWHEFDDDGTLHMRVSIYEPHCHSSGMMTVKVDAANYSFWCWVIEQPEYKRVIGDSELSEIREKFEHTTRHHP